jgi:DNA ligase-1
MTAPPQGMLIDVARASAALATTSSRNAKVAIIADALRTAGDRIDLAAAYLAGAPPQTRLEVGWATVRELDVPPAATPTLGLADVDAALTSLATAGGAGSRGARQRVLESVFARATAEEQRFLSGLVLGEIRQGALAGLVTKAVAAAAGVPEAAVRRALMLSADLGGVAAVAVREGRAGLDAIGLQVGRGVQPMLASTSTSVGEAVADMGTAVVEWKLDGARIQVHRDGDAVTVFTRNLNDVTGRSPDTVAVVRSLPVERLILDGEVLAVGADGRPVPFQDTISTFANEAGGGTGLTPFFFDVLHVDGEDLLDLPLQDRRARLAALVPERHRIPSAVVSDPAAGEAVLADALGHGHEGVMVKALDTPYAAGRRGKGWRKVKPVRTLDLVVLAVEWGSGRRQGWLSNIHLGAVDDRPGREGFVMLGKTFKGMTDEVLAWQTARFLELETGRDGHVVHVRPEQVVEIALDGVQTSRRYPGGVALRFARVLRYRDDKHPEDCDTLSTVRALGSA